MAIIIENLSICLKRQNSAENCRKTTFRIADFMLDSFHGMCMAVNHLFINVFFSFGTLNHSVYSSRMMGTMTNITHL